MIIWHASTILPFILSFSRQSAGGIFSFCLNIDNGFLLLLLLLLLSLFSVTMSIHYHYLYLFSLCSLTGKGEYRARDLKSTIPHTHIQCPPRLGGIGYLDKAGWSARTVLAEMGWTGHGTWAGEFVVVGRGGGHRDTWVLRNNFALRRLGSAGGWMDGWARGFFSCLSLSLGRFALGGSRREREACWSGPAVGGSAFFILFFFQRKTQGFFFFKFVPYLTLKAPST